MRLEMRLQIDDTTEKIGQKYYEPKLKTAMDALEQTIWANSNSVRLDECKRIFSAWKWGIAQRKGADWDWDAIYVPHKDMTNARQLHLAEVQLIAEVEEKWIMPTWKLIKHLQADSQKIEMNAELSSSEYLLVRQDLDSALQAVVKSFDTLAIVSTPTENERVIYNCLRQLLSLVDCGR